MRATSVRATAEECRRPFPGDALLKEALGAWTHAVTIDASPLAVWYSWDFVDNGGRPSANQIVPELQHLSPGDILPAVPGATDAFVVERIHPGRDLVLTVPDEAGAIRATWEFLLEPVPGDRTRLLVRGRASPRWLENQTRPSKAPVDYVYRALAVMPRGLMLALAGAGHGFMQARQLRGIRRRAEAGRRSSSSGSRR